MLNLTYGNSYVTFQSFPFFLGETMRLTLTKIPKKLTALQLTLRCIEGAYEIHGTGENKKSVVARYHIYKEVKILENVTSKPTDDVSVLWHLPDDKALTSTPSERPSKFWELEVITHQPLQTYQSRFLLPVYASHL